jgi:hypothetical protein
MAEIRGVAFPIPKQFAQRFFEGKDVFVKPATVFRELKPGMRSSTSPRRILALLERWGS